jgi:phage repressor protein C with HTH and peptisase S24 domain
MDDAKLIGARLAKARRAAGYDTATAAAEALGVKYPTYAAHENGSRGVPRNMDRYARFFRVSLDWLLNGQGQGPRTNAAREPVTGAARTVPVSGFVEAGAFAEIWDMPEDDWYDVPVPDDARLAQYQLYAAEARGPSMNRRYPEGTVLIYTNLNDTNEELVFGKRYIVERERADGLREATVKTLWRDENGKAWLLPESTDPRYQEPIPIEGGENDTVRIVGRVRYAVTREG